MDLRVTTVAVVCVVYINLLALRRALLAHVQHSSTQLGPLRHCDPQSESATVCVCVCVAARTPMWECDQGYVGLGGTCVMWVAPGSTPTTPATPPTSGVCGGNGQPVCTGAQLQGV